MDIINGFGYLMIVFGILELFVNILVVFVDVKFLENKIKSVMVLYCFNLFKNLIEIINVY